MKNQLKPKLLWFDQWQKILREIISFTIVFQICFGFNFQVKSNTYNEKENFPNCCIVHLEKDK